MEFQQVLFCGIMVVSVFLFMTDFVRADVVGVLIILALTMTGILDEKAAFSGFASEPAIIVAAVFVLSAGLSYTGVTDKLGQWVARVAGRSETLVNIVVMATVAALSAFTHHLMVTAMMLPIVMQICKERGYHSSRLLIPMATSASLGTTLTLIGAPAFLLANSILQRSGAPRLGLFEVGKVGGPLVLASFAMILLTRWLLPQKSGTENSDDRFRLSEITTELIIPPKSVWIGQPLSALKEESEGRFKIFSWFRDHRAQGVNSDEQILREGDVLLVKTSSDELVSIEEGLGLALRAVKKYGESLREGEKSSLADETHRIFQAVIAPRSEFIGKSLAQMHFHDRFGVVCIGIWRKSSWVSEELSEIVLREGDLVVLWGPEFNLDNLTNHRGFLMFLPFQGKSIKRLKASTATLIMAAAILVSAAGWLPPYVAFTAGAVALILSRCLSIDQGYESIETKIYIMIAGVIPLGLAMEQTQVDKLLAEQVLTLTQGWAPFSMLLVFFWFAALLTQILSDAATTVLLAPIAIAFAKGAEISPTAAVVTVTIGAVASFLTPIGHHGNLLVLSAGNYRFADFLKIGLPLTVMISILTCYLSLRMW